MYGPRKGFAQQNYVDQQATALPGMLANASDINLVYNAYVGFVPSETGLESGLGVIEVPASSIPRSGINYSTILPPFPTSTSDDFFGVTVRHQFMRTNSKGATGYDYQDVANVAKRNRSGSSIWVRLGYGSTILNGEVYWIVRDTNNLGIQIGSFSGEPIGGVAVPTAAELIGGSLNISEVRVISSGVISLEIDGAPVLLSALDFSAVTSIEDVLGVIQVALVQEAAGANAEVFGNRVKIVTQTSGATATIAFASSPAGGLNFASILGLTADSGALINLGSDGETEDTVLLPGVRFKGFFKSDTIDGNNVALIEMG